MDNSIREYVENRINKDGFITSKRRKKDGPIKKALVSVSIIGVAFTSLFLGCGKKKSNETRDTKTIVHEVETTTQKPKDKSKENITKSNTKKVNNNSTNTTTPTKNTTSSTTNSSTNKKTETTVKSEITTKTETKDTDDSFIVNLEETSSQIIYDNNIDYKIVNENGELVTSGSFDENKNIEGYVYDENRKEYVREEEVNKYIYSDIAFYDSFGNIVIEKGMLISIETYENAKRELNYDNTVNVTNVSDENVEESSDEEEIIEEEIIEEYEEYDEGVLNDDLTYTVNGVTFESKEVYEYFLLYPDEFYKGPDGIIRPISNIEYNEYQKTLK